ncbi:CDP-glycerol glycerophosphotransferase family protein [Oceanobacillus sojae]|uniref:CDP-glycerol glycerophosphotransferase family protein n=1 Tax=Oceanobacillus sojae TaxID=582851 RepID=UPI0021A741BE|nr:CDP-glycerol glycerophosphotransferase family protein [Oceanobacillus sojae]MCT1905337.1 CDP-glycerol glycerophosphotransferase family protein [Oceanobacillus sojae]
MARELAITAYLFAFRILFEIGKGFPQKNKTVAVASFGDNISFTVASLRNLSNEEIYILKDSSCRYNFDDLGVKVIPFTMKHPIHFLKSIYHLATAKTILLDTYQGFLASTNFRSGTTCIQLWHAAGALKRFGLEDPTNEVRSNRAMNRFKKVYSHFDYSVVGSEKMADSFKQSFGLSDQQIIRTGVPRSDLLFDQKRREQVYNNIRKQFPSIRDRKIILYTPTFRNNSLESYDLELDLHRMNQELSDDYVLFIKLHPAVSASFNYELYEDFVYDVSDYKDTNELLLITDLLISDYSSIPFEYAILEKPMIFFAYDLEEYKIESGLIQDYEQEVPGPVVSSTNEIIRVIQEDAFDYEEIHRFNQAYNEYSQGHSSNNLAMYLTGTEEKESGKIPV